MQFLKKFRFIAFLFVLQTKINTKAYLNPFKRISYTFPHLQKPKFFGANDWNKIH